MKAGRFDVAVREFTRAVEAEPADFELRMNFGAALALTGDYPAALTQLKFQFGISNFKIADSSSRSGGE